MTVEIQSRVLHVFVLLELKTSQGVPPESVGPISGAQNPIWIFNNYAHSVVYFLLFIGYFDRVIHF